MKKLDQKGFGPVEIGLIIVIVAMLGGLSWYVWHMRAAKLESSSNPVADTTKTTDTKKTSTKSSSTSTDGDPVGMTANINKYDPAGLLNASYTRKLTNFTPWSDSKVSVVYRDFNDDKVTDAFVWAKVPGTMGYSYAAVWTLGSNEKPKELWYVPDDQHVAQSSWSVSVHDALVNKGKAEDGTSLTNSYHWQVTSTGKGFVLEI